MFNTTIKNIIFNIWPMIIIMTVILSSIRITSMIKNKEKFILYDELLKLGFLIYIISLFYVVTFQDVSWSTSNFIPFKEMFRYRVFSTMFFKNVIGNMIMFLPYGFFISYILKLDKKKIVLILSLLISITIEVTQLIIGRVFDVDDILLNVVGGLLGYFIYRIITKIESHLPTFLKNNCFYNIMVSGLVIIILVYVYKIIGV